MRYNVEVTCIADNPSINSKVEVIEAESLDAARELAEYLFGPSRIVEITVDRFHGSRLHQSRTRHHAR